MTAPHTSLTEQAKPLLRRLLADGQYHPSREVLPAVCALVGCKGKVVVNALYEIGGEMENHTRAGSKWRLPRNATDRPRRWTKKKSTGE